MFLANINVHDKRFRIISVSLNLNSCGEHDLLHGIWRFIYWIFTNNHIQARLGKKTSVAVTLCKNQSKSLEGIEKRPEKNMGSRGDVLFTLQGQGVRIQ